MVPGDLDHGERVIGQIGRDTTGEEKTYSLGRQVIFEDVPGGTWTAVMRCERRGANLQLRQQRLYALLDAMEGAPGARQGRLQS